MRYSNPEVAWHSDITTLTSLQYNPLEETLLVASSDSSNTGIFLRVI